MKHIIIEVLICPKCNKEIQMDGNNEWAGKNLKCRHCKEYHYYENYFMKEYTMSTTPP